MDCAGFVNWMHDRLDGRLSAEQRDRLQAHVAQCATCEAHWIELQAVVEGLVGLRRQSRIEEAYGPIPSGRSRRWVAGVLRVAAALGLACGAGIIVQTMLQQPGSVRDSAAPTVASLHDAATVQVSLVGDSIGRYLLTTEPTGDPRVHLVWLHQTVGANQAGDDRLEDDSSSVPDRAEWLVVAGPAGLVAGI